MINRNSRRWNEQCWPFRLRWRSSPQAVEGLALLQLRESP
jgi:hypothetical protein